MPPVSGACFIRDVSPQSRSSEENDQEFASAGREQKREQVF
jgi:hypothetical protein